MKRPQPDEYNAFYQTYIDKVGDDVLSELKDQIESLSTFLKSIPQAKINYAYAEGKWTVKEVLGHIIDTERIMSYRLLRFARNDASPLPGFQENDYVKNSHYATQDFNLLIEEMLALRKANLYLFNSLIDEELERRGVANNSPLSVRALLFILAGHLKHHVGVLKERYL
ncbi:MAG TPA: DinB family protein [Pedobacter sp.]|jgi:hypothetical protein